MDEKDPYTRFLGIIPPWCVNAITLDEASRTVRMSVHYRGDRLCTRTESGEQPLATTSDRAPGSVSRAVST